MNWQIHLPHEAEPAVAWMRELFGTYDTSALKAVRIDLGSCRYEGVYGHCLYPTKSRSQFRISCHLPGPFPCKIVTRKSPLHPRPDGTFERAPRGCRRGILCHDPRSGRQWYRVLGKTCLQEINEAVIWIVSHEAFHFLRRTRQVKGRDNEIDADRFADDMTERFRSQQPQECPPAQAQLTLPWTIATKIG